MTLRKGTPRHSGYGPGKGSWTKRRYDKDGNVLEGPAEAPRGPGVHTRFVPFVSHQVEGKTARALGLKRTRTRGTVFQSEAQLNAYLAHERRAGRDVAWKDC